MEPVSFYTLGSTGSHPTEMRLGCAILEFPKDLFLAEKLSRRARVLGHEDSRRRTRRRDEAFDHPAKFLPAAVREGHTSLDAFRRERHQASLHDVPGVLDVGRESEDFR